MTGKRGNELPADGCRANPAADVARLIGQRRCEMETLLPNSHEGDGPSFSPVNTTTIDSDFQPCFSGRTRGTLRMRA